MNSPAMQGSISSRPQLWEIFNSLTGETGKKDIVGVGEFVRNSLKDLDGVMIFFAKLCPRSEKCLLNFSTIEIGEFSSPPSSE